LRRPTMLRHIRSRADERRVDHGRRCVRSLMPRFEYEYRLSPEYEHDSMPERRDHSEPTHVVDQWRCSPTTQECP
jgi:hypothetical protein